MFKNQAFENQFLRNNQSKHLYQGARRRCNYGGKFWIYRGKWN